MISKTIIKELKEISRDGRFRLSFLLIILLTIIAVFIANNKYQSVNAQHEKSQIAEREVWDNQGEKNPHSAAHFGTYVFKSKNPLSLLDQGVDEYEGVSILMEAHSRNEAQYSAVGDKGEISRFSELSPEFILLYIIPLLIIIIGYNSFTKEKEGGTFVLLKSQGISGLKLTTAKLIAVYIPVFIITSLLFVIAGIMLSSLDNFNVFNWSDLFALYVLYLVYYLVFIQVVLCISSVSKNSGLSLVTGLSFWILACFIAPKVATNFADTIHPFPSKYEFAQNLKEAKKGGVDGHNPWNKEAKLLQEKVLKEHGVDSVHKLPFNFRGYLMQKGEEHEAAVYFKEYAKLDKKFNSQAKTYKTMAFISPFLPARFLSMGIATTGYQAHSNFADAAEKYRILTQKFLNDNTAQNSKYGERGYTADADFWKTLPPFKYQPESLVIILSSQQSNIVILFAWLLVSGLLLFISTKKI